MKAIDRATLFKRAFSSRVTTANFHLVETKSFIDSSVTRTDTLPFVTDDLFINFDDDRAAAGFQVLTELAQKTQVLFFTHHQHLVNIARDALGASVHVINLQTDGAMGTPSRPLAEQA